MPTTTAWFPAIVPLAVAVLVYLGSVVSAMNERRIQKRNTTRALLTEIHSMNRVVDDRLRWLKQLDPTKWLPPLAPLTIDAYDHLADKIVVVDARVAPAIIQYYGYVRFINGLQLMKGDYESHGQGEAFFHQYVGTLEKHRNERGEAFFSQFYADYGLQWSLEAGAASA